MCFHASAFRMIFRSGTSGIFGHNIDKPKKKIRFVQLRMMKIKTVSQPDSGQSLPQKCAIAAAANFAVPAPPARSMFSVNSPPAAYIFPRPARISSVQG